MRKPSALKSWLLLILSLPKGIAAFVIAVTGVCAGLPLLILGIGLPLLAATFTLCRWMMAKEVQAVTGWMQGEEQPLQAEDSRSIVDWKDWRSMLSILLNSKSYRGILYSIAQLPVGIAGFTLAVTLPAVVIAIILSPAAYKLSKVLSLSFDLYSFDGTMNLFLPWLNVYQRSWVAAAIGIVLVLLLPMTIRGLGRLYSAWIGGIAGDLTYGMKPVSINKGAGSRV
ncbi:sensor domain-containing protein [Paenibacillus sp. FSL L8-0470]|uniref:sensor domain-containing protein n=1 Tax=unclassified Paenibacillus TaxID=185978 RepID=UPI0030FCA29D